MMGTEMLLFRKERINMSEMKTIKFPGDKEPRVIVDKYAVHYDEQTLTEEQQAQVQENIGLIGKATTHPMASDESRLGEELIATDGTGWTLDGWTGNLANGFTHTVGSTGRLTYALGDTEGKTYYLEFDVASPTSAGTPNASTAFTVTIGNSPRFITYDGGGSKHYAFGIRGVEDGNLEFIPTVPADPNTDEGTFNGTISNISLREVVAYAEPAFLLKDKNGNVFEEKRLVHGSTYIGMNSGRNAFDGAELNTAFGNDALRENTTGYWNTAIGSTALRDNTTGSRNVAVGKMALEQNITGDRNIAIGTFTLCRNTSGRQNIGIGADTLWYNTTGNQNVGIGMAAVAENVSGSGNVGVGYSALHVIADNNENTAIGHCAMGGTATGDQNVAVGCRALYKTQGNYNVAIGTEAMAGAGTGTLNTAVGTSALKANTSGKQNTAIGNAALQKVTTGYYNVGVGVTAGGSITTGNQNIVIGNQAGNTLSTGGNNVLIGFQSDTIAGANNSIVIGRGAIATKSNSAVIGNDSIVETLLKGNLIVRGTDGVKRQIVFNADGTCSWSEVTA
jgi:hypothetical protein